MTIRQKGYQPWEGELQRHRLIWLPIAWQGIRAALQKKRTKWVLIIGALPTFVTLLFIYLASQPQLNAARQFLPFLQSDTRLFNEFFTGGFQIIFMMILVIIGGADAVAGDLRHRALALYFGRPLSRYDYLTGKLLVPLSFVWLYTLVPALLLIIGKMAFTGRIALEPRILPATLGYCLVVGPTLALIVMALSMSSQNRRVVQAGIVLVFFFSTGLAHLIRHLANNDLAMLLSLQDNLRIWSSWLFGQSVQYDIQGWWAGATMTVLSLLLATLVIWRIRRAEASL